MVQLVGTLVFQRYLLCKAGARLVAKQVFSVSYKTFHAVGWAVGLRDQTAQIDAAFASAHLLAAIEIAGADLVHERANFRSGWMSPLSAALIASRYFVRASPSLVTEAAARGILSLSLGPMRPYRVWPRDPPACGET